MGIDDRDYMKDRYWARQGKTLASRWSFNKAERDAARKDEEVLPGGAGWVGSNSSFDEYDRIARAGFSRKTNQPPGQHGGRKTNRRRRTASAETRPIVVWVMATLCIAAYAVPMLGDMRRGGWLPDSKPGITFPETGTVVVARDLPDRSVRSRMKVRAGNANAVVQLVDPETGRFRMAVFVGAREEIYTAAPVGTWQMRVIEGQKWHGPAKYFGPNTQYETVAKLMEFREDLHNGIDLNRRVDGNLKTRIMLTGPEAM